jgi:hypothetical protein
MVTDFNLPVSFCAFSFMGKYKIEVVIKKEATRFWPLLFTILVEIILGKFI